MIRFENVSKSFWIRGKRKTLFKDVNLTIPSGRSVALIGRNGAGKSTLLKMFAGTMEPTSGRIISTGTISWPVGFAGSFHGELTGAQNTKFIARIYGVDSDALKDFVEDFAGLGGNYYLPFRTYSSGMKSRLAFGVSMGIDFETYLVDEVTAVGDASFQAKSNALFKARMENAGAVVVTHAMGLVRQLCDTAVVLDNGRLTYYEDLEEAIEQHEYNMLGKKA